MLSFVAASSLHAADTQLSGLHTTALVDRIVARDDGIFDEAKFLPPTVPTTNNVHLTTTTIVAATRIKRRILFLPKLTHIFYHARDWSDSIAISATRRMSTTRQGILAPHVKSLLWLHPHLSPQVLDGKLEYSHMFGLSFSFT
jgi:hypothetical protein